MKVWKYYKIPDEMDSDKRTYELYAYTDDKEYMETFEKERNLRKFIKRKAEDIEPDEFKKFQRKHQNCMLDMRMYSTKKVSENGYYESTSVQVLSTYDEYVNCSEEYTEDLLLNESLFTGVPTYKIFDRKLLKSLKLLEYDKMMRVIVQNPIILRENEDDYLAPDVDIDEFAIFVHLYGELFK